MAKILVAYFSASGVTAAAARGIAAAVGGELFEIAPAERYTSADLDWTDRKSRSTIEMNDDKCRPAMAVPVPDLGEFDTVFVGFPVWWYVEPRIVDTFLESARLAGKKVIPFCTSGGSGISGAERRMKELCPLAVWRRGKRVGADAGEWAKSVIAE